MEKLVVEIKNNNYKKVINKTRKILNICDKENKKLEIINNGKLITKEDNIELYNIMHAINIKDKSTVLNKDYKSALKYLNSTNTKFNIILVDAPYKMKVMDEVITLIDNLDLLSNEGLLVLEFSFDKLNDNYHNLKLIKSKKYSDKFVYIYRKVID